MARDLQAPPRRAKIEGARLGGSALFVQFAEAARQREMRGVVVTQATAAQGSNLRVGAEAKLF
jgi:hypothetical protein